MTSAQQMEVCWSAVELHCDSIHWVFENGLAVAQRIEARDPRLVFCTQTEVGFRNPEDFPGILEELLTSPGEDPCLCCLAYDMGKPSVDHHNQASPFVDLVHCIDHLQASWVALCRQVLMMLDLWIISR